MKKNVLICSYSLCIGGIEKSLINLLKNINYDKYNIDLILEQASGELIDEVPSKVNIMEYKPFKLKIKLIRKSLNYLKQLKYRILLKNTYDASICFATYSYPSNLLTRLASKNTILYIHSDYTKIYDEEKLKNFFDTRNINDFKHIIFVSNESKNNLIKYYPNIVNKSKVINNLIDINDILEKSKDDIKLPYNKKDINLLFVGRLEEESKNILYQLEIINDLKNKYNNIKLYIIGDGKDRELYENYIKSNNLENYVKLLGSKINPYPYIKKCDYILLTSNYEGYPVIFNESIVLKKDIISTIEISDEYTHIGKNFGFLLSKKKQNFIKSIEDILDNKLTKKINIDMDKINKKRLKELEMILDEE